ncbi:YpoC family protein [Filibacter tadaridae]|uniref:YpoC-like domain-containing protein n=1 Tax=Filibacter tadaridae TaxID=2483811 RepID=A0A3P5XKH2_9BACL|nr:hypothetical protein [Filibacter tadaridae]VDC29129.1 hypothetical protein FILTAD_01991 [Filibacter tadaridae]
MPTEENSLENRPLTPYFDQWESIREKIERLYDEKDYQAVELMKVSIEKYGELLELGGTGLDERTGKLVYKLIPLNGVERFEFVKSKVDSHYAYIQLDALFTETKKKAARLAVMKK